MSCRRQSKRAARNAVEQFFREQFGEVPHGYRLHHDGETSWCFYILPDDTTSYVHHDLRIEWYGTSWEPGSSVD